MAVKRKDRERERKFSFRLAGHYEYCGRETQVGDIIQGYTFLQLCSLSLSLEGHYQERDGAFFFCAQTSLGGSPQLCVACRYCGAPAAFTYEDD